MQRKSKPNYTEIAPPNQKDFERRARSVQNSQRFLPGESCLKLKTRIRMETNMYGDPMTVEERQERREKLNEPQRFW